MQRILTRSNWHVETFITVIFTIPSHGSRGLGRSSAQGWRATNWAWEAWDPNKWTNGGTVERTSQLFQRRNPGDFWFFDHQPPSFIFTSPPPKTLLGAGLLLGRCPMTKVFRKQAAAAAAPSGSKWLVVVQEAQGHGNASEQATDQPQMISNAKAKVASTGQWG